MNPQQMDRAVPKEDGAAPYFRFARLCLRGNRIVLGYLKNIVATTAIASCYIMEGLRMIKR
jgi:hypothetical protein